MQKIPGPVKVLLVGDSHGNFNFFRQVLQRAKDVEADLVIQLGDFGFWPPERDSVGRPFPDPDWSFANLVDISATAEFELPVWAIRGNHDWREEANEYPTELSMDPGLYHCRDGQRIQLGDVTVLFTGGAVSVDYHSRTEGISWWPDEITSDEDVAASCEGGPVDLWLTHDSVVVPPNKRKLSFGELIDARIDVQNLKMKEIFEAVKPKLHVHGHWHSKYTAHNPYGFTQGVSCESENALLLLSLDDTIEYL